MQPCTGKVALITGAGRGIGKAIALALSRAGCRLALAARTESQLQAVSEDIAKENGAAVIVPTDLSQDNQINRLVDSTLAHWGTIDYLINNAGGGTKGPVVKGNVEDWDQTFKVNLRAPMLLAKLVLPTLMAKKGGAVVNIGSISAKMGQANVAAYSASKFGLVGLTESLFEEVREYGIKVSVIHPGYVDTRLIPQGAKIDRGKMIRPEDVAQAVLFVLTASPTCCPVEITIRPQKSPYL
jgi:3-oxoacyl-[acyl-carrier protein] reductase